MSCLPLLFDQRDGLGAGGRARPENVPPASSHIELLLEKHGNGEMGVNSECDSESREEKEGNHSQKLFRILSHFTFFLI